MESRHYEILYGIIYYIGEFSEENLAEILEEILPPEMASEALDSIKNGRDLRLYLPHNVLSGILDRLGSRQDINYNDAYEYVLVFKKVSISSDR